jgi:hypothetical protein
MRNDARGCYSSAWHIRVEVSPEKGPPLHGGGGSMKGTTTRVRVAGRGDRLVGRTAAVDRHTVPGGRYGVEGGLPSRR